MVWLSCTLLVLLAGTYVLTPLFRRPKNTLEIEPATETELDRLLDRKSVVSNNLSDLELEYKMGRLSESDFEQLSAAYKSEAADILQRLDNLSDSQNRVKATRKGTAARKTAPRASESKPARDALLCPSCGAETLAGKKFCGDCGHRL